MLPFGFFTLHAARSLGSFAKCRIAKTTSRDAARESNADPGKPGAEIHGMPTRTFVVHRKESSDERIEREYGCDRDRQDREIRLDAQ